MMKRLLPFLCAFLLLGSVALADLSAPDANLAAYQEKYGEASEKNKLIRYGADGEKIASIKEALSSLGYFPYRVSNNYYRTLETAIRVFCQQMRIGGDGQTITPLVQAMLADAQNLPKAISPAIDVFAYSWEPDGNTYIPYTYARVTRANVREDTKVGFSGLITATAQAGGTYYYVVRMENDPAQTVYVSYKPLPRTTVFQVGDSVAVFGVTHGSQSLPYENMAEAAVLVSADRVGYTPE